MPLVNSLFTESISNRSQSKDKIKMFPTKLTVVAGIILWTRPNQWETVLQCNHNLSLAGRIHRMIPLLALYQDTRLTSYFISLANLEAARYAFRTFHTAADAPDTLNVKCFVFSRSSLPPLPPPFFLIIYKFTVLSVWMLNDVSYESMTA